MAKRINMNPTSPINQKSEGDKGFIFFFNGGRIELYAADLGKAGAIARGYFQPSKSKQHMVHGMVAEDTTGTPIVHSTASI